MRCRTAVVVWGLSLVAVAQGGLLEAPAALARPSPAPVEEVAGDVDRSMLQVKNQTPFIVIIYVGKVRIGWIRPYRTGLIRSLATGYHKLYAHSQYGTMSWGPRDSWIPGTWNLIY